MLHFALVKQQKYRRPESNRTSYLCTRHVRPDASERYKYFFFSSLQIVAAVFGRRVKRVFVVHVVPLCAADVKRTRDNENGTGRRPRLRKVRRA